MQLGNNIPLEFTTTSCNRPELLEATYKSFTSRLIGVDFSKSTLYINIDPAPNNINISEVESIANKYFGNVVVNYPEEPNFANAVIWCFAQVKGDYFFHLEDDWVLNIDVHINDILSRINSNVLQCVLNKKPVIAREIGEPMFVPSLFRTEHLRKYLPIMDGASNPEAQMKYIYRKNQLLLKQYKSIPFNKNIEVTTDIGRAWLLRHKISRDYAKTSKINNPKNWSPWITWKK